MRQRSSLVESTTTDQQLQTEILTQVGALEKGELECELILFFNPQIPNKSLLVADAESTDHFGE
jgi:hypothetical protein